MRYYPFFVDTQGAHYALLGGDDAALAKLRLLQRSEAQISVFADAPVDEIVRISEQSDQISVQPFERWQSVSAFDALFVTLEDEAMIASLYEDCQQHRVSINVVDRPEYCSVLTPAIVDRDPLVIAIGTEGTAPVLARHIKSDLEGKLPLNTGELLRYLNGWRDVFKRTLPTHSDRLNLWQYLIPIDEPLWLAHRDSTNWKSIIVSALDMVTSKRKSSEYHEITPQHGQFPFDKDARATLQRADVLLIDAGVEQHLVDFARRDAEHVHLDENDGRANRAYWRKQKNIVVRLKKASATHSDSVTNSKTAVGWS